LYLPGGFDDDRTQSYIALTSGAQIGHYRIVEKIGAGGMGEVYLAEDTELDRRVALKFLPPHLCQDEDCRKRFKREAQAAAKLSHPNIITIHEVGDHQGRPFFAMEHVEGRSLRDVTAEEFDIDRIVGIAIQLCDALQNAHTAGVTHRDVKPSNIIIDSAGRPRLVDFGLATVQGGEQLTKTGSTLGTVGYMSPEQIDGKVTDARSDLFSLGVVLYELIANKSPFRRDDETTTFKAILHDDPEPLARYKSNVADDLQRIIGKLLEKDPALRYQTAAGVIPDFKKLSSGSTGSVVIEPRRDWWNRYVVPTAVVTLLIIVAIWYFGYREDAQQPATADDRIMLAVLPFENLGDPDDEYFADGMTEEITARLAVVHDLGVIARTSVVQYKQTEKSIQQIGKELGVDYILEGTIRWQESEGSSGRIRVTPQLIKVSDATHAWADIYDEVITQVFDVQSDIARKVVDQLGIVLASQEQQALETKPTENLQAYDLYIRGREYRDRFSSENDLLRAVDLFEQAIALDSSFAAAYGTLSMTLSTYHWYGFDKTGERVTQAREMAETALAADPDGPWGQLALGYHYYYGVRDYDEALRHFERVVNAVPNEPQALSAVAFVKRRQGAFDEAADLLRRALKLDPLSFSVRLNLTGTLERLRLFDDGERLLKETSLLYPENRLINMFLAVHYVDSRGDLEAARAVLRSSAESTDSTTFNPLYWLLAVVDRDFDLAITIDPVGIDTVNSGADSARYYLSRAQALHWGKYEEQSQAYYDSARVILESSATENLIGRASGYPSLGMAYAGLGRKEDAIRAGRDMVRLLPVSEDAFSGTAPLIDLARIYARTGELDSACNLIESVMAIPANLTYHHLRLFPSWDPLRDYPRFQALIEKYEREQAGT
jgi:TolB-like protein/predicted Ser/Thr protein kinase